MLWQAVSVVAFVTGVVSLGLAVGTIRRLGSREAGRGDPTYRHSIPRAIPHSQTRAARRTHLDRHRVAFIVNPTKPGLAHLREAAYRASSARHLPEPLWLYTTVEDPGTGVSRQAVAAGAEILIAVGGDGTVRAVAAAAADSGLPMAVIPLGTGNLLARNLGLPLRDVPRALDIALDGSETLIDIGRLMITDESGDTQEHPFLVVAGIGLDAEMVAGAKTSLKSKIGWLAYVLAVLRHLGATRMRATISVDDQPPVERKMRTVLIANCGRLPAGVVLVPDARIDDGTLDVAILDARGGLAGWTELAGQVWLQGTRITAPSLPDAWRVGRIDHSRGTSVEISAEAPQRVQIDGELLGSASAFRAWVEPGAVRVRQGGVSKGRDRRPVTPPQAKRRRSD